MSGACAVFRHLAHNGVLRHPIALDEKGLPGTGQSPALRVPTADDAILDGMLAPPGRKKTPPRCWSRRLRPAVPMSRQHVLPPVSFSIVLHIAAFGRNQMKIATEHTEKAINLGSLCPLWQKIFAK